MVRFDSERYILGNNETLDPMGSAYHVMDFHSTFGSIMVDFV